MKFRAVLKQPTAMRDLHGIIAMLSRVHKETTLVLLPDRCTFVLAENVLNGTPWLWADIVARPFFDEYHMQGVDGLQHNRIVMTMNAVKLSAALAMLSRAQVRWIRLKLTNRQFPCLSIDLDVPAALANSSSSSSSSVAFRTVTHDVPVQLVAVRDWPEYDVPRTQALLAGARSIRMPSVRSLRTLVDRIRNLSPSITVYYNNGGELSLVIETDQTTVASHYRHLPMRPPPPPASTADNGELSCRVSSKQLAMILGSLQMPHSAVWWHIEQDALLNVRIDVAVDAVTVNCMFNVVAL